MNDEVESLICDLSDPDGLVQLDAVDRLKKLGDGARSAVPSLRRLLADDATDSYVKLFVGAALAKVVPDDSAGLAALVEGLSDPSELVREVACDLLGERRNKEGVLQARKLLGDSRFPVRFAAARAIGVTFADWSHAVAVCVAMLKDRKASNRRLGGQSLVGIRRHIKSDLIALRAAMNDVSWEIRLDIEQVLAALHGASWRR